MREVRFHIHRKSAFAGALLPYRMYINGQYIGTIRNGKSRMQTFPKQAFIILRMIFCFRETL